MRFNQVYGYYIEITNANLGRVPPHYIRKQTLVNGERFMTPELKELEERVTGAEVKLLALEQQVFAEILARVASEAHRLEVMAQTVSHIDVLAALAETAALNRYTRPMVDTSGAITIKDGRHPVVERLGGDMAFVPNDTVLDLDINRMLILTGPNMAGQKHLPKAGRSDCPSRPDRQLCAGVRSSRWPGRSGLHPRWSIR